MRSRLFLTSSFLMVGLVALSPTPATAAPEPAAQAAASETDRINQWFDAKYEEQLKFSPIEQTMIGRKTDYGLIDDFSDAGADRELAWLRSAVAEMKSRFDYAKLSPEAKTSYDIWLYNLEQAEAGVPFRSHRYVLHQHNGLQSCFPTFLINTHKVATEADMVGFIQRLSGVASALDQLLVRAQANAAAGTRAPRFAYEGVIDQSTKIISGAPFGDGEPSAIWTATEEKLQGLVDSGVIDEARASVLREQEKAALTSAFAPAYQRIIAWYEADLPNTDATPKGVGALADGQAFYNYRLANQTTTELTADEIHNLGLSEVARLRGDMEAVKDQVGFDGDLKAFFKFIREDDRFYFSDDDAGADQYIAAAKEHIGEIKKRKCAGSNTSASATVRPSITAAARPTGRGLASIMPICPTCGRCRSRRWR